MQFRINSSLLQNERNQRAWTQQHLADASELSLRTIQRIETNGTGSHDSILAIASALGLSTSDLLILSGQELQPVQNIFKSRIFETQKQKITTISLILITLLFIATLGLHSKVLMAESSYHFRGNVIINNDDGHVFDVQVPFDSVYEIVLTTEYKLLIITPESGGKWDATESKLLQRTGLSSYEIQHSANIIGPVTKTRAFYYLVCNTETIFNTDQNKFEETVCPG